MKRDRSSAFPTEDARIKRAIAINSKMRSRFPYSKFGTAHYLRGSPQSLRTFGPSYKEASIAQRGARQTMGFTGRGMYMGGKGGYWGRKIGGWFGKADLGDRIGDIGSSIVSQFVPGGSTAMSAARAAGRVFSGQGSYTANSLVAGGDPIPSFVATPDGASVVISHREYIGDIFAPPSNATFQNSAFSVNPGLERTFPWLSQIAQNYDEYTIRQLMFSYRSTVSDFAAASGQIGQVLMATQYNAASEPFSDKAAMMQYDASMSTKTSESMIHGVECDPTKLSGPRGKFVRANPVLVGQDINQYDHGLFNIAVTETPPGYANQAMGELWVSYTVELRKPKFFVNRGLGISRDVYVCETNTDTAQPFGLTSNPSYLLIGQQNNIGTSFTQRDPLASTIPAGLPALNGDSNNNLFPVSGGGEVAGFSVTFPANYTGTLRVVWRQTNTSPGSSLQSVYGQGNIFRMNDIYADGSDTWYSWSSGGVATRCTLQVLDIRVDNAANGVDNVLYFVEQGVTNGLQNVMLDISEYNAGLSYKQDGTRDQLILVDRSGTVQNL